jgi:hypothetical protein
VESAAADVVTAVSVVGGFGADNKVSGSDRYP